MPYTICVLGCGTMGISILSGVLDSLSSPSSGRLPPSSSGTSTPAVEIEPSALPSRFIACVSRPESVRNLKKVFRDERVEIRRGENLASVKESDVVLLCCKPQQAKTLLQEMHEALDGKLLVSILAGTTIKQLKSWVPASTHVIRAMPNTPTRIREGMTVISALPTELETHRTLLLSLFYPIGRVNFLDEKHFDAVTALSGSGPAFVCLILEAMADGGVMMGLPRKEALEIAGQCMQGAARMVLQTGIHPSQIKDDVTTPGGCTIAGLLTLEDGKVRSTMARCIETATRHAAGLGKEKE
ncbi:pyrroline-5-carboxylate reductase [Atractiella rhizophila]|nr:pyrroline-5-carboxylate reductase [Atractiella rhizophila]